MAEQSQGDLRQIYTDLGLSETVPITTNYMVPLNTSYMEPVSTIYPNPITTLNYPYYSAVEYINTNPDININLEGQMQEEIVFDQNVVNVTGADTPLDMSVPLDMTIKKDNVVPDTDSSAVEKVNSVDASYSGDTEIRSVDMTETVENETVIPAVPMAEEEDFGEVLQKCPICQKMFMKSDYENFHINTHNIDTEDSNVPEESAVVTEANLQTVNEEVLYCTEADFQNEIEENVYATAANFENGSQENVYVTSTDFQSLSESTMYVSKADLQTTVEENVYVTGTNLQSTYEESVYATASEFQDMAENMVYASKAGFENLNTENVNVVTTSSIVSEGDQESTFIGEVRDTTEKPETAKKLVTIEYREISSDSKRKASLSRDVLTGTTVTEALETSTAEYNIPYSIEADVNTSEQFHINTTAEQALNFSKETSKDTQIPVSASENGPSNSTQSTEFGKNNEYENDNGEESEALNGCLKLVESSTSSFPTAILSDAISEVSVAAQLPCTTQELPTTVLELEKEFETVPNVITETIIEHLPDSKVTGLIEPYDNSESSKALPRFENMQIAEKTLLKLNQKLAEKLKADENMKSVPKTTTEQMSENVASDEFSIIDKDVEEIPKMNERVATTICTQTEGTFNLQNSYEPLIAETNEVSSESYKSNEKEMDTTTFSTQIEGTFNPPNSYEPLIAETNEVSSESYKSNEKEMDKSENVDNNSTVANEVLVSEEQQVPETVLQAQIEAKSVLNELHIDEVKSILDELINQASLIEKVQFKSSLDSGSFLCSRCSEMFETDDALKNHLKTDHSDEDEAFAVHDPQGEAIVNEDKQLAEKKAKRKIKSSTKVTKDNGVKRDGIEKAINISKKNKDHIRQTKTLAKIKEAQTKTPETKKIESFSIFDSSVILEGKRKRSLNRKFGPDFIVDIDIIDAEVKKRKKHSSGSESPLKSPIKPKSPSVKQKRKSDLESPSRIDTKPKNDNKETAKQLVKMKTNSPFFTRLTIQRKLVVISNGLRECPICYRRVYGQLGLKSHMDSHTPDTDKIPEKPKEPVKKLHRPDTEIISENPRELVKKAHTQDTDKISEKPKESEKKTPAPDTDKISGKPKESEKKTPTPDIDKIPEISKESVKKPFTTIEEAPKISNNVPVVEEISAPKVILQEQSEKLSETEVLCDKPKGKAKQAIQDKLASMQEIIKENHQCQTCNIKLSTQKGLLMHMKIHQKERELTPEYESKKVIQDKLVSLGNDLHECPVCSRMIAGKYPFKLHMKTHNIEAEFDEDKKLKTGTTKKIINKSENEKVQLPEIKTVKANVQVEKKDNKTMDTKVSVDSEPEKKTKTVIQEKLASIVGGELHECPICSRLIYGKVRLESHLKSHSPVKKSSEEQTEVKISKTENDVTTNEKDNLREQEDKDEDQKAKSGDKGDNSGDQKGNLGYQKDNSGDKKDDSVDTKHDSVDKTKHSVVKEEILECSKCSKRVHGQHRLTQHMQSHTRTEQLKENLSRLVNQREKIMEKRVSLEPLVECSICSKQVHGQYRLDAHMKYKHKDDDETEVTFNFKSGKRKSVDSDRNIKSKRKIDMKNDIGELDKSETEMEIENLDGAEMETEDSLSKNNSSQYVKCTVCFKLQKKEYLRRHMRRVHSSDRQYECKICSASFSEPYRLTRHEKIHAKTRDLPHKEDLNKHLHRHSGKPGYKCKQCKREFITSSELTKHQKVHLARSSREHCCIDCGKNFTHYYQLTKHQRLHRKGTVTVAMKHSCTKCGRMFATRSLLEGHLPVHDLLTKARATKHSCRKCGKHFQYRHELENHIPVHNEQGIITRSSTPEITESKCPKVTIPRLAKSPGLGVNKAPVLKPKEEKLPRLRRASTPKLGEVTPYTKIKINKHSSGKSGAVKAQQMDKSGKLVINIIGDSESTKLKSDNNTKDKIVNLKCDKDSELLNHKKTNNTEPESGRSLSTRKTSCKICGKIFSFKANLMQHLKAHSEIREYSCRQCGKYFSTQDLLNQHTQSHKNGAVTCGGCKKKFAHGKSLKRHLLRCVMRNRESRSLGRKK